MTAVANDPREDVVMTLTQEEAEALVDLAEGMRNRSANTYLRVRHSAGEFKERISEQCSFYNALKEKLRSAIQTEAEGRSPNPQSPVLPLPQQGERSR